MFYYSSQLKSSVGKYEDEHEEYLLLLKLRIYLLIAFAQHVGIFSLVYRIGWFSPLL